MASKRQTESASKLCEYAAATIRERMERMLTHLDGVREGKETEPVHQMRVWSRRTRAALDVFRACFPAKAFAVMEREVKRVTRALGTARDLDVMILAQEKRLSDLPEHQRAGLEAFLEMLRGERTKAQESLTAAANHLEQMEISAQFDALTYKTRSPKQMPFLAMAGYTIDLRLYEMQAFVPYLATPDHVIELHEMRIAAKRLRYTLEIFAAPYAEQTAFAENYSAALAQVKAVQEALGNLHDADVLVPRLARFAAHQITTAYTKDEDSVGVHRVDLAGTEGLVALCRTIAAERDAVYHQLVKDWRKIEQDTLFETLRRNLQQTIEQAETANRQKPSESKTEPQRQEDASETPIEDRQTALLPSEGANAQGSIEESEREQKGDAGQAVAPVGTRQRRTSRRTTKPAAKDGGTTKSGTDTGTRPEKSRI